MSKKKLQRQIIYVDREPPGVIELRQGQELVLANSFENFKRNFMIVRRLKVSEAHFTDMALAGLHRYPEMLDGTYVDCLLVCNEVAADGELSFGLGYAHIQDVVVTRSLRYRILPRKSRKPRSA